MYPYSLWILMIGVIMLVSCFTHREAVSFGRDYSYYRRKCPKIFFWIVMVMMIYFSANTIANDVAIYRNQFDFTIFTKQLSDYFDEGAGSNPIFMILQSVVKNYISEDPAILQLICAAITQPLFLHFFRKYSPSMPMSLFMFIASGLFFFTMVSWKQSMAMGIGLSLIAFAIKRKWLWFYGGLYVAMFIHPYIIMYGIFPLLINDKAWTKKNILIVIAMAAASNSLSDILGTALDVTENVFGDRHDEQLFSDEHSVSLPRIMFFSITPLLSWIFRKRLNKRPNPIMNGFIQMSVVCFGFFLVSLSGGANLISRMGTYFEPFIYVALPYILTQIIPKGGRLFFKIVIITMFIVFFSFLQLKRGSLF